MNKNVGIKKNIVLQVVYQTINTLFPLITAPYLARILGKENLGIFSFTNSIVTYFLLFAMLGTVNYGTRTIAMCKNNTNELNKKFNEIYFLQFIMSFICLVIYILYLLILCKQYYIISFIQIIAIINCMFDINWLYNALEMFDFTIKKNIIVKVLTVISILAFVRSSNDLWIYTLIMVLSTIISSILLLIKFPKKINFNFPNLKSVMNHIKPNFVLFIPILAQSIFHVMDKTMLGFMSTSAESGFYYNADKIINIPIGIIVGISAIMLPRITTLIYSDKKAEANALLYKSIELIMFLSIAMSFGIISIAKDFIPVFFGKGYDKCILLTYILAPALIIKSISITLREQCLIPNKKEILFIKSVCCGSIINIILNSILIPKYGSAGASIGTLAAEFITCIVQIALLSKNGSFEVKKAFNNTLIYIFCGIIMFGSVYAISLIDLNIYIRILVEIILGAIVFIMLCFIYWKKTNNYIYDEICKIVNKQKQKGTV